MISESPWARVELDDERKVIFRGLRVRMGIHMGRPDCKADAVTGRADYFGPMVNRAARIASIACGGQILISKAVHDAVSSELDKDVFVTHMGDHYLKGLTGTESIVEILPKTLSGVSDAMCAFTSMRVI